MKKIKVGVNGASGYAGIELLTLLQKHSSVEVVYLTSEAQENKKVRDFEPSLVNYHNYTYTSMKDESIYKGLDAVFLSLPHEASAVAAPKYIKNNVRVIDLSAAYRIKDLKVFEKYYKFSHPHADYVAKAVFGLTEIYRDEIKKAELVANPGCYPSSVLLPLMPLYKKGLIQNSSIIVDSKSSPTGRGRKTDIAGLFYEMNQNHYAYGIGEHRHKPEMVQELSLAAGKDIKLTFTPHIIPVDRGIYSTIYIDSPEDITKPVLDALKDFYKDEPFIKIFDTVLPQLKWVSHTNACYIGAGYDQDNQKLVIVSTIDNLIKGAAGQAIQNMNVMFGFHETDGLL
jgi:N-acetyl-gamma-glutamyl-phosphate reductase